MSQDRGNEYRFSLSSFFDSKNIVLFIEVIKGIYHTSVLHTKHLRHKKMEVNFYSLFTLSLEY